MKPILFNTEMVRAILDSRKTVTRRVIKQAQHAHWWEYNEDGSVEFMCGTSSKNGDSVSFGDWAVTVKPPYKVGDVLYVRETWSVMPYGYVYRADDEEPDGWDRDDRWMPSIHMPKEAARLFLRVTGVSVERLQEISMKDAVSEGCITPKQTLYVNHKGYFSDIWNSTIKPAELSLYGWEANPWVWVIEFEVIKDEEMRL